MRLPGSHNTKEAAWTEVQLLVDEPTRRYELEDLAEWLETVSPVLHRKPTDSGNGHDIPDNPWLAVAARSRPPIHVESRLAAMRYQGAGTPAFTPHRYPSRRHCSIVVR